MNIEARYLRAGIGSECQAVDYKSSTEDDKSQAQDNESQTEDNESQTVDDGR